jgi:RNA polymerase sigma factor (sigma-70 family)
MPNPETASIRTLCLRQIAAANGSSDLPDSFEDRVVRSVESNLAAGRFQRFCLRGNNPRPPTLVDYVDRVIYHARREYARVQALERRDDLEWDRLWQSLFRRASRTVQHFRRGEESQAEARDFAQQACEVIYHKRYPFDVSFDVWTATVLKNLVLAHYTRSRDVLSQPWPPFSLDQPKPALEDSALPLGEMLPHPQGLAEFERTENKMVLIDAIKQLRSKAQKEVIVGTFLEERSDEQIARQIGKSKQAVYNLRLRALARLKEILAEPTRKNHREKSIR